MDWYNMKLELVVGIPDDHDPAVTLDDLIEPALKNIKGLDVEVRDAEITDR